MNEIVCCKHHSGIKARLEEVEDQTDKQWRILDTLRNKATATLTGVVLILLALVANLIVKWPK